MKRFLIFVLLLAVIFGGIFLFGDDGIHKFGGIAGFFSDTKRKITGIFEGDNGGTQEDSEENEISNYKFLNASRIDFEAGGFVLNQIPTSDGKTIYARTDIGGIYKKTGNDNWIFISHFGKTPATLFTQGIDINPFNDNEIIAACGSLLYRNDPGRGLWKSSNGGKNWKHVLGPDNGEGDINFGGNSMRLKTGRQCTNWHPSVQGMIVSGGLADVNTGEPNIFLSNENGDKGTWKIINRGSGIKGNVVSVQMHRDFPDEIWIGTDKGLWRTKDKGNTWSSQMFPDKIKGVYQIILKKDNQEGVRAFVTTGRLFRIENDGTRRKDLTDNFGVEKAYGREIILLMNAEKMGYFYAGEMGAVVKRSSDNGETWSGHLDFTLERQFNPKFTLPTQDKIYTSNIQGDFNPANPEKIYMSGGSGPFISTNSGKTWRFHGNGIDMVVVYDVSFSDNGDIYIPISDWGMAKTNDATLPRIINYSRQSTLNPPPPEKNGDSYMPNVSRVLISHNNPNRIYLIGGSVFTYYPVICKSENRGEPNTYQIMTPVGLPSYPKYGAGSDAIIVDGDITTDGHNDHIILLVGGQYKKSVGTSEATGHGLYYSSNNGISFEKSIFTGESEKIYKNSVVGGLFSPTDYIDADPKNKKKIYFYLEGGNENGIMAGGLFISEDYGKTFLWKNYVVEDPATEYRNKGAIDINPDGSGILWAAIENTGLYKSENSGESFSKVQGWLSALTVDTKGKYVAAFGIMEGDSHNKIYLSENGGKSWKPIFLNGYGVIPSVRKLDIRENKDKELWISTGGQGMFIVKF